MPATQEILVETEGPIATIRINRPQVLNALNEAAWRLLDGALGRLAGDPAVRVVLLVGEGRAFCAGADLREMVGLAQELRSGKRSLTQLREFKRVLQDTTRKMVGAPQVFIAAVHGYAVGGGLEICLACDLIVAGQSAKFGFPEVNVGLTITNGGTYFLPRLVGLARAKELALTGEFIDAVEAHRIGLINRVVPDGEVVAAARKLAQRIATRGPLAVQVHKTALNRALEGSLESALTDETEAIVLSVASDDHQEGARAFLEKRDPKFQSRP